MDGTQAIDTPARPRARRRATRDKHQAVDGFTAAADELFGCAYRAAYKILGDAGRSEDVAQEALIRALTHWEKVETYAPAWTTRVASNLAIDDWRRHRAEPDDTIDIAEADPSEIVHIRDELNRALAVLPPRRREAIVLRFLCDLSPDDAAMAMGTSVAGVLKHTVRGLADLRRAMGSLPDQDRARIAAAHEFPRFSELVPA